MRGMNLVKVSELPLISYTLLDKKKNACNIYFFVTINSTLITFDQSFPFISLLLRQWNNER